MRRFCASTANGNEKATKKLNENQREEYSMNEKKKQHKLANRLKRRRIREKKTGEREAIATRATINILDL